MATSRLWKITAFSGLFYTTGSFYLTRSNINNISAAHCSSSLSKSSFILYQYQTCPFCCKARAFLDYHGLEYETVEVNPLSRKEINFSNSKKVPILTSGSIQINDSTLIASVLRSRMILNSSLAETLDMYPEVSYYDHKKNEVTERANKYFLMYGEGGMAGNDLSQLREEREWREWVDTRLVHTFSPNIYRTMRESFHSFRYISKINTFSKIEKFCIRYFGSVVMYFLGKRLKTKYELKDDVRLSLYECCDEWIEAIGEHRFFMGGDKPNLADLAVYGALSALEEREVFNDMITNTTVSRWYFAVKEKVENHQGAL